VKTFLTIAMSLLPAIAAAQSAADRDVIAPPAGRYRVDAAPALSFSGNISYSYSDQPPSPAATISVETVTNSGSASSGPLRLSFWLTSLAYPYSSVLGASYFFLDTLAAGASIANVRGLVPFAVPPIGCYTPTLALDEYVDGVWIRRDYADFSRSDDFGNACIASFTAAPARVVPGGTSTLTWSTLGSVDSVTIDKGVGTKPANGSTSVAPAATTTYTLTANHTANTPPPSKSATVVVGPPPPPRHRAVRSMNATVPRASTVNTVDERVP
jgi:hypothetical protein